MNYELVDSLKEKSGGGKRRAVQNIFEIRHRPIGVVRPASGGRGAQRRRRGWVSARTGGVNGCTVGRFRSTDVSPVRLYVRTRKPSSVFYMRVHTTDLYLRPAFAAGGRWWRKEGGVGGGHGRTSDLWH